MAVRETLVIEATVRDLITQELQRMGITVERFGKKSERSLERGARASSKMTAGVTRLARSLAGLATAYVGFHQVTRLTREAVGFGRAMAEVSTIVDTSVVNMDEMTAGVLALARAHNVAETEVAKGLYQAISAGAGTGAEAIHFLEKANRLAIAGLADSGDTVRLLASSMNAYGASAEQAEAFSDSLFKTVQLGITTIPELAGSLGTVTPIAAALGVEFDEMNAVLAELTKGGIKTDVAVTGLKAVLTTLLAPSQQAKEVFEALGIELGSERIEATGLAGILEELMHKTRGNADVMAMLFENVRAVVPILRLTSTEGSTLNKTLDEFGKKAGVTAEGFEKMHDSLGEPTIRMWRNLGITIKEFALTPLVELNDELSRYFENQAKLGKAAGTGRPEFMGPLQPGEVEITNMREWEAFLGIPELPPDFKLEFPGGALQIHPPDEGVDITPLIEALQAEIDAMDLPALWQHGDLTAGQDFARGIVEQVLFGAGGHELTMGDGTKLVLDGFTALNQAISETGGIADETTAIFHVLTDAELEVAGATGELNEKYGDQEAWLKRVRDLLAGYTEETEKAGDATQRSTYQLATGLDRVANMVDRIDLVADSTRALGNNMARFIDSLIFEDEKMQFHEFALSFARDISMMITRMMALKAAMSIMGWLGFGGGGGGGGGTPGHIPSGMLHMGGRAPRGAASGARAGTGYGVHAGEGYRVAERNKPELVIPLLNGDQVPMRMVGGGMGGGPSLEVNVYMDSVSISGGAGGRGDDRDIESELARHGRAIGNAVAQQLTGSNRMLLESVRAAVR